MNERSTSKLPEGGRCLKALGDKGFGIAFCNIVFYCTIKSKIYLGILGWFSHENHGLWYPVFHTNVIYLCCTVVHERLDGFILGFRTSGDMTSKLFLDEEVCYVHHGSPGPGETLVVTCPMGGPTHGRYVYIYLPGDDRVLSLCEVEVYEFAGI